MSKRVLLIKLTSMGDLMHALPAITDASHAIPGIQFDWVVDEAFADVPSWHPAVNQVIKSAHRRWKKNVIHYLFNGELQHFYRELNHKDYDIILDTQNNIKSAAITWLRHGESHGLDKHNVREKPAHWAYTHNHAVNKSLHAVTRQRQLFAQSLGYDIPKGSLNYGIDRKRMPLPDIELPERYLFFVHNASWTTKLWPQQHWHKLIAMAQDEGYHVLLPCGNEEELTRAKQLAQVYSRAIALPKLSLTHIAGIMNNAAGAVCCDTGLAHLASILDLPSVSLYGPTDHKLIGAMGLNQYHIYANTENFPCSPCYKKHCSYRKEVSNIAACMESFTPVDVWSQLQLLMNPNQPPK